MGIFVPLVIVVILAVGCSGSSTPPTPIPVSEPLLAPTVQAPSTAPSPTPDVSATVEAAVQATREVDRMLRIASGASAVPTATPVVMTLLVPTPEPFVVAPGEVEEAVDQFIDCFHGDAGFRAALLAGMEADLAGSGMSQEEIEFLVEELLSDREGLLSFAEEEPDAAVALVAMGGIDDVCTQDASGPVGTTGLPSAVSDEFLESMVGLYDCMQENEALRAVFLLWFKSGLTGEGASPVVADALMEAIMRDREVFLEVVSLGAEQDSGQMSAEVPLSEFVDALCGGSSGSGHDLGMTDSEARALLGDFFDCAVLKEGEILAELVSEFGESFGNGLFDALISDRESFVEFVLTWGRLDQGAAASFAEWRGLIDAGCP